MPKDQRIHSDIGTFDSLEEFDRARFRIHIQEERSRQIEKGYDGAHDDAHGVDHLLLWAQEYLRTGAVIAGAALIEAAREKLQRDAGPTSIHSRSEEDR